MLQDLYTRKGIVALLKTRAWFRRTSYEIRDRLLALPQECDGFLRHLAKRPCRGGGIRIIKLADLLVPESRPIFGILVNFQVQQLAGKRRVYHYMYLSLPEGEDGGAKGLILIRRKDRITHIAYRRAYSFGLGVETHSAPGGGPQPGEERPEDKERLFTRELFEEIGIEASRIVDLIDLGVSGLYPTFMNAIGYLFAAVVEASSMEKLFPKHWDNLDPTELDGDLCIVPVKALWGKNGAILKSKHPLFNVLILRLVARGYLRPPRRSNVCYPRLRRPTKQEVSFAG